MTGLCTPFQKKELIAYIVLFDVDSYETLTYKPLNEMAHACTRIE